MPAPPPRPTPPWVFTPLMLPFGAAVGYLQIAAPFWLRSAGVSLVEIGAVSATAFLPHAWKILWVPLLDVGPYRKRWYAAGVVATAGLLGSLALLGDPGRHLTLFTLLVTAVQVTASTSSAAVNALSAISTRASDKGRAGGYLMAGNVGGTGILGALALFLVGHSAGVATKYALFTATSNQAISYVTWLDGKASAWRGAGARGALAFDAVITFAGLGVLLLIVAYTRRRVTAAPAPGPR